MNLTEVQSKLRALAKRHYSIGGWIKFCQNSPEMKAPIGHFSTSLAGLLLYFFHGLAPMIIMLCSKLDKESVSDPELFAILKDVGEIVMVGFTTTCVSKPNKHCLFFCQDCQKRGKLMNEPEHAKIYLTCLKAIQSVLSGNLPPKACAGFMLVRLLCILS